MAYNNYYPYPSNLTFTLRENNYYRFGRENSNGRFCFEFVWLSGTGRHLIGFSNSDKSRTFMVYFHQNGSPTFFYREPGTHEPTSLNIGKNIVGMVCVDTYISKFTAISGGISDSKICPSVVDSGLWFAYLDYELGSSAACVVEINLGESPFYNQMPYGYYPWMYKSVKIGCFTNTHSVLSSLCVLFKFSLLLLAQSGNP